LPHAGGGASEFHGLIDQVDRGIDVCPIQTPGREERLMEPAYRNLPDLVAKLVEEIEPYLDIPFAVLGCSVGALVGFELARRLDQIHAIQPTHLFVCANRAPQLVHRGARVHALPTNQFIDAVRELAGTPDEVFQNQELVELVLPTLRADFALYETYKFEPKSALTCPITVFGGDEDPTTSAAGLMAWRKVTSDQCTVRIFNAGHFVLQAHAAEIAKEVSTALGRDWTLEAQPLW